MKYELVLFERGETPSDLTATVICAHDSREVIDKFIERGKAGPSPKPGGFFLDTRPGRKGREVIVRSVEPGTFMTGFSLGEKFPSAQAASDALRGGGATITYNVVAKGLEKVRHLDSNERTVTIEGITFQYFDDALTGVRD